MKSPGPELPRCARLGMSGTAVPGQTQGLFGIVQGGMDPALRKESAERTIEIGFPGYAIGGLSVGEPRALTREVVESTLEHLPSDKPRYLMGVGTPEEIVEYAGLGVDMMDCVLPTRAARHGLLFTSEGRVSIKQKRYAGDQEPLDPKCGCRVCQRYSRADLRYLYAANQVLAQVLNTIHNLTQGDRYRTACRVKTVCADDQCEFGKWLGSLPPDRKERNRLEEHQDAACAVPLRSRQGARTRAERSQGPGRTGAGHGQRFLKASAKLVGALDSWKG